MEIQHIDLSDWEASGGGALGTSFCNRKDSTLLLKIDNRHTPLEKMQREISNAEIFFRLGLPTPEPGKVVTDGVRYGLTFRRISGKMSMARAVSEAESDGQIQEIGRRFAVLAKRVHGTVAKGTGLACVKDFIRDSIMHNPFHPEGFKSGYLEILDRLPDGDTAVHGDLHFGNVISAGGRDYLIDLDNASYGYFKFDLAMTAIVGSCGFSTEEKHVDLFHCGFRSTQLFHQACLDTYFGKHTDPVEFERDLAPYIAMRLFSIENQLGRKMDTPLTNRIWGDGTSI